MNGSIYERELAGIFSGTQNVVEKFARRLGESEKGIALAMLSKPFFVTRSAGSLGADLIAMRHDYSLVIEVKSSISDSLLFTEASGRMQDQANRLQELCQRAGLFVVYAYRMKSIPGDPWRMFTIPGEPSGRIRSLYEILPKVGETKKGNFSLKWKDGMPLSSLLDYMNQEI